MTTSLYRKGIVLGIICLFIGASVVPSISGTLKNGNDTEPDDRKMETVSFPINNNNSGSQEMSQENQSITIYLPQKNESWNTNDSSNGSNDKNGHLPKLEDTIIYENFEGAWPGDWACYDEDTRNGEDYWGDSNYRAYVGSWSGYCADESDIPGQYYDNYMWAKMNREIDLSNYDSATLSYYYWLDSETDYDFLKVGYYEGIWPDGYWVRPKVYTGDSGGWVYDSLSISTTATWIGFLFESDQYITAEGAYIDEICLTGVPSPPPPAPTLISPGSGSPPGSMIYTLLPTFYWTNVPNADYYGLYISKYPYGPSNLVFDSEVNYGPIYGTQFTLPISYILTSNERFAWNMRSHNSGGWGPFSSSLFFQTPPVYEITFQDDPTNGGTITFNTITYSHGQVTYVFPQNFNIVANPASGYVFDHWSSTCGTVANPNSASTTITVSSSGILKAWFTQDVIPPAVQTNGASNVGDTYATLNGQILNDGGEACQIRFRYKVYGSGTWTYPSDWHGSYNSGQTFSEYISSLNPGTTYEFQAGAKNSADEDWGDTEEFITPPDIYPPQVQTNDATNIDVNSATLNGQILNDGGEPCQIRFKYREVGSGSWIYPSGWHGSYNTGQPFSESISGLSPDTNYEFEAGAKNTAGEDWGTTKQFTTPPDINPPSVQTNDATVIEETDAILRGEITDDGGENCQVQFRYRQVGFGTWEYPSDWHGLYATGELFSETINNLDPEGTYEFQAGAKNSADEDWGEILEFTMPGYDPFYFIHITDPHVTTNQFDVWAEDIKEIRNMNPPPDFVLCTGDLVDWGADNWPDHSGADNYDALLNVPYLTGSIGDFSIESPSGNIPIYFCPGNHDARYPDAILGSYPFPPYSFYNYYDKIGPDYFSPLPYKNCRIFSLNSGMDTIHDDNIFPPEGDGLDDKYTNELTNFENDVAAAQEEIKIVMLHHPYLGLPISGTGRRDATTESSDAKIDREQQGRIIGDPEQTVVGGDEIEIKVHIEDFEWDWPLEEDEYRIYVYNDPDGDGIFDHILDHEPYWTWRNLNEDDCYLTVSSMLGFSIWDIWDLGAEYCIKLILEEGEEVQDERIMTTPQPPKNGAFLNGRARFLDACNDSDVDMVFCGHMHEIDRITTIGDDTEQINTKAIHGEGNNYYRKIYVDPTYPKGYRIDSMTPFNPTISGGVDCQTYVHIYDELGNHNGPNATGEIERQIPMSTYSFCRIQNDTLNINMTHTEFMLSKNDSKSYTIIIDGLSNESMSVSFFTSLIGGNWTNAIYSNVTMYNGSIATVYANESTFNYSMAIVDPGRTTRIVNPTLIDENHPPVLTNNPIGPTEAEPGKVCNYSITAIDPNDDDVHYWFDWGDGTNSSWLSPYHSNETCIADHSWDMSGTYEIRVKTKDDYGLEGNWSDSLTVNVKLQANDWNMFRHDAQHTGYSTSTAPETNNILWNYTTGNKIVSSPAVVDDRVYITSMDNKVYCLNGSTGDFIWSFSSANTLATSSVAVYGNRVYVGTGYRVYCLNATTGSHIWNQSGISPNFCSPTVADNKVYIGSEMGKIYCMNALTGEHIWNYSMETPYNMYSTPSCYDGNIYTGSPEGKIYCLDATTGSHIWNYTTGSIVVSSPTVANSYIYVGSYDHNVYCLDASTGVITTPINNPIMPKTMHFLKTSFRISFLPQYYIFIMFYIILFKVQLSYAYIQYAYPGIMVSAKL